jgi:CRP-like cAMP-binding protein
MDWTISREWNEGLLTLRHRTDEKIERMAALAIFDGCSRKMLATIARLVDFVQVEAGDVVMREGAYADQVILISKGRLRIERDGAEAGYAGKGEMFGEMQVLSRLPYSESLVAVGSSEVGVIGVRDFLDLLDTVPCLALKVLQRAAQRQQQVA